MTDRPVGHTSIRCGPLKAFRAHLPRNAYFTGLYILGCANGLGSRLIKSFAPLVWTDSIVGLFEISAIIWIACFVGILLILRENSDRVRPSDLLVGAIFLPMVAIPSGALSWLAVSGLSLYVLLVTDVSPFVRRGV